MKGETINMQVKNYMEDLVWEHLDHILSKHDNICDCEKCKFDIAALALNLLSPHYVVTAKGETYTRVKALEQQFNIDIFSALTQAIKIVSGRPQHQDDQK